MSRIWRFQFYLVGGILAMSTHLYLAMSVMDWFAPQRLATSISGGLIFGYLFATMVLVTRDIVFSSQDLVNRVVKVGLGVILGAMVWGSYLFLILSQTTLDWGMMIIGGAGLSLGFSLSPQWVARSIRSFLLILLTVMLIYVPIWAGAKNFFADHSAQALLYFSDLRPQLIYIVGIPFAGVLAFFGYLPALLSRQENEKMAPK